MKLTPEEHEAFKIWVASQDTKLDAALKLKVAPNTIDRLLLAGSGSDKNIKKVKRKIAA